MEKIDKLVVDKETMTFMDRQIVITDKDELKIHLITLFQNECGNGFA